MLIPLPHFVLYYAFVVSHHKPADVCWCAEHFGALRNHAMTCCTPWYCELCGMRENRFHNKNSDSQGAFRQWKHWQGQSPMKKPPQYLRQRIHKVDIGLRKT